MFTHRLKILFLVLEMDLGGLQRMVDLLIRRMDKETFEPYLACMDRGGVFYEEAAGACAGSYILKRRPGPFDRRMLMQLVSILKENRINIIHSHNGCSLYAAVAGRLAKVNGIVHTDHGRWVPDKRTAIWEDRVASYFMNKFVGVSAELTDYLESTVGINGKRLMTITNGVDTDTFKPLSAEAKAGLRLKLGLPETGRIVGTVCRLDLIKNLAFMIDCMPSIIRRVPDAHLVIVGDGPVMDSLTSQASALGVSGKVTFLGLRRDIEEILPAFDIYACSSLSEGTSMTILEAMSCGLPIIASAVGGNLTLVNDSNGSLFPLNDSERFTHQILELFDNPDAIMSKGRGSRELAEQKFSVNKMVFQYEKLYAALHAKNHLSFAGAIKA